MADKFRLYVPCPKCNGMQKIWRGVSNGVSDHLEFDICPNCVDTEPPLGAKDFDGVRHVYYGRFEEVVEE